MSSKQRTQSTPPQPPENVPRPGDGDDLSSKDEVDQNAVLKKLLDQNASLNRLLDGGPLNINAHMAAMAEQRKVGMAQAIMLALLRNPSVHTYLGGSPLEPLRRGDVGDHDTVGGYLAAESLRLADDYCDALDRLVAQRRPVPPEPATT